MKRPDITSKPWGTDGDLTAVDDSYNSVGFSAGKYPSRKQLNAVLNRLDQAMLFLISGIPDAANVNTTNNIGADDVYTETQADNQNITLFDPTLAVNVDTAMVRYLLKVAHNNVTVSSAGGVNLSYVPSRTFNKGDWVILINNNVEWFVGS